MPLLGLGSHVLGVDGVSFLPHFMLGRKPASRGTVVYFTIRANFVGIFLEHTQNTHTKTLPKR
jgi:hypothetical protein